MPAVEGSSHERRERDEPAVRPCERDATPQALASLIAGEIIPRLLEAHRGVPRAVSPSEPVDANRFALDTLSLDVAQLLGPVEAMLSRGVSVEQVMLDLLAPAARRLGELWESDACDFVDVTMGLWRIQQLVHEIADRDGLATPATGRDALFAVAPGEQHSLGSLIVEECFRRAGWRTASCCEHAGESLEAMVAARRFALVGLTVTCAETIEHLPPLIAAVRAASRNPDIAVMVGGRLFSDRPELAAAVGADGTAPDAVAAVARAEALLGPVSDKMPLHH